MLAPKTEIQDIMPAAKISYLDNIKVLLTILVIIHHAFVAYGAPGGWYYRQVATDEHALIALFFVTSTNQSFFMGLFFLISAYFTEASLKRKGFKLYMVDRFKRLGTPVMFYSLVLSPVTSFLAWHFGMLKQDTFMQYVKNYDRWIDFGGIWFLAALLLFAVVFAVLDHFKITGGRAIKKLHGGQVLCAGLFLGLVSFLVRIAYPTDQAVKILGFHLGQFPQYIFLFIIGIMAGRGKLAEHLDFKLAKRFTWLAVILLAVFFPVMCYVKTFTYSLFTDFNGGMNWKSLLFCFYEQMLGLSIMVALTGIVKHQWNQQPKFVGNLSRNAFAVYVFHPIVLVCISLILSRIATTPTIKLAIAAPTAVICSFLVAALLMKVPVVRRIL